MANPLPGLRAGETHCFDGAPCYYTPQEDLDAIRGRDALWELWGESYARLVRITAEERDALVAEVGVIRRECERYGLPLSAETLLKHIYANRDAVLGAERVRNEYLKSEVERLRAIEAAALDWDRADRGLEAMPCRDAAELLHRRRLAVHALRLALHRTEQNGD